jgi:hypothetical protein
MRQAVTITPTIPITARILCIAFLPRTTAIKDSATKKNRTDCILYPTFFPAKAYSYTQEKAKETANEIYCNECMAAIH